MWRHSPRDHSLRSEVTRTRLKLRSSFLTNSVVVLFSFLSLEDEQTTGSS